MSVIKRSDLITDEAFNWPKSYAQDLEKLITKSKALGQGATKKNMNELSKVQNQLSVATERSTKEYVEQKAALNTLNTTTRNAVKDVQNLDSAYDKLSKELNDTRKAYKNLAASGKENTKVAKDQLRTIQRLDGRLKSIDNSVGQNQRSVGKYSNAIKGMTARFIGWGVAIAVVTRALASGFRAVRDNSKANAELRGILNKTRKETIELRKEQLRLGGSTVFTATQVTKAQTELSRLGLSMQEIITLTPAILDGAVALGVDMAQAAELVAGQLNAFNLAATEGKRVTDVLVRATQISAFNFERLKVALGIVSPAANAVNITLEEQVSILSAAVDANIDASTAATGLRNIFIDLADKGITWEDAMNDINTSTNKLSKANELFGKRGAVVSTVIAANSEKIAENTKELNNATGAAEAFAQAQKDNLSGDQLLWTSAWEGFFQQLNEGNSAMSATVRWVIGSLTAGMQAMTRAMAGTDLQTELWQQKITKLNPSLGSLGSIANKTADDIKRYTDQIDEAADAGRRNLIAEQKLEEAQTSRAFILGLIKSKLKEVSDAEKRAAELAAKLAAELAAKQKLAAEEAGKLAQKAYDEKLKLLRLEQVQKLALSIEEQEEIERWIDEELEAEKQLSVDLENVHKTRQKNILSLREEAAKEWQKRVDKGNEEDAKKAADDQSKKDAIIAKSFETTSEIANRFTNLRIEQIGQELTAVEFARDRELELAGDNERQKFEINAKFDKKRRDLQRKQAIAEKANAIFQVAIGVATGIAANLKTPFLIPFIVALGAIQAAAVLAAPIPQFDKGKESTPKDYIAGEKRPELRKSKGKWSLVDKPTLFKDSAGDKIVSGKETDSILGSMSDLTGKNLLTDKGSILSLLNNNIRIEKRHDADLGYILQKNNADLIRTIKNKKEVGINISTPADVYETHRGQRVNRIDKYYKR